VLEVHRVHESVPDRSHQEGQVPDTCREMSDLLNEKKSKHAFPEWVPPDAHNALIGCMRCQKACPYDKDVADWYEDRGEFSEQEVAYLLKASSGVRRPPRSRRS